MTLVSFVVGTRPQIIKLASLVREFEKQGIDYIIVHTGQHYDYEMDSIFFEELNIPKPTTYLGVGSGTHGEQTGKILIEIEKAYIKHAPRLAIVPGDTNSALAAGLAAIKLMIDVAHVEAGLRSRELYMAEEINRILLDHLSSLLFSPTNYAYTNLLNEGIDFSKIFLVGDVMYDNIILFKKYIEKTNLPNCADHEYIYVTCHRAENVDYPQRLKSIVDALIEITDEYDYGIIFPVHPRTHKKLIEYGLLEKLSSNRKICILKPVSYFTNLKLIKNAVLTITDSGGVQKESFILGTPIVTMRTTTEWIETVEHEWNILVGYSKKKILTAVNYFMSNKPQSINPAEFYGEGKASYKIAQIVKKFIEY
jgi:UDP-N-acetylglucosamine 2-epimerase (non-hydrolysing)